MTYSPLPDVPESGKTHVTDYSRWRLSMTDDGGHLWNYLHTDEECKARPQTTLEKYWLGLPVVRF
jgi:lanosterol synthase